MRDPSSAGSDCSNRQALRLRSVSDVRDEISDGRDVSLLHRFRFRVCSDASAPPPTAAQSGARLVILVGVSMVP